MIAVSAQVSLHLSRRHVSDFVLIHSLTATLGTLDYLFGFHHGSPPNMDFLPSGHSF